MLVYQYLYFERKDAAAGAQSDPTGSNGGISYEEIKKFVKRDNEGAPQRRKPGLRRNFRGLT